MQKIALFLLSVAAVLSGIATCVSAMGGLTWALFLPEPQASDVAYAGCGWALMLMLVTFCLAVPALMIQDNINNKNLYKGIY